MILTHNNNNMRGRKILNNNFNLKSEINSLRVGSINMLTLKDEMKVPQAILQCKYLNHDLTFIQETHMTGSDTIKFESGECKGWSLIYSGFKQKHAAGVGIAVSPNVKVVDIDNAMEGRILIVRAIVNGICISAISAYAPTENKPDSSKDLFYNTLERSIMKVKHKHSSFKCIIGADMNSTIGIDSNKKWKCLGENNDNLPTNINGNRLLQLCESNNLYIMNSLFESNWTHRHS